MDSNKISPKLSLLKAEETQLSQTLFVRPVTQKNCLSDLSLLSLQFVRIALVFWGPKPDTLLWTWLRKRYWRSTITSRDLQLPSCSYHLVCAQPPFPWGTLLMPAQTWPPTRTPKSFMAKLLPGPVSPQLCPQLCSSTVTSRLVIFFKHLYIKFSWCFAFCI